MNSTKFQLNGSACADFIPQILLPRLMLRQAQQPAGAIHLKSRSGFYLNERNALKYDQ